MSLFIGLIVTLAIWHKSVGWISVDRIASRRAEIFYWVTVMFSQMLGTALGDWMADTTGLGYEGGAIVFAVALGVVAVAYFYTRISRTVLFWAAFILTRPLGATVGDLLDKPLSQGGLALGRYSASAVIAMLIVACILLLPQRAERRTVVCRMPQTPAAEHRETRGHRRAVIAVARKLAVILHRMWDRRRRISLVSPADGVMKSIVRNRS